MNLQKHSMLGAVSAFMAAGALLLTPSASAQAAEEDVQILTRGPVHEAFAESVSFEAEAGVIISTAPPEAIEEMPPEQQLEGDNVTWIPGYWNWDDDQNDFIWISGIWRNLPPGRQWVPGYWSGIDGGSYQWTSGYWADSTSNEVEYVSTAPPRSVDAGPNVEAPSSDHNWTPGNWYWADTRYVWRPGYWVPQRENWTWMPSHYNWTRRGYVYVDGYWDYAVARRGVLFAPVSFRNRAYARPGYYYTPTIVVALNVFSSHLFVRPSYGHYYFGDYYAPRYRDSGFHASFSWHSGRHGYDPIYAYDRWDHRSDRDWERRRSDDYNYFRDHEDARPPRTWAAMRDYRDDRYSDGRNRTYATSLSGFAKDNKSGQRFRALDDDRRKQFVSQRQEMNRFGQERRQMESRGKVAAGDSKKTAVREKLNRSPITGRDADRFAKDEAPPKRPEARGDKSRIESNKKGGADAGNAGKDGKRKDGENANDRRDGRGVTPRDDAARDQGKDAAPGRNRDEKTDKSGKNEKADRDMPGRDADASKESPKRKNPGPEIQPKQDRKEPERKPEAAPKRESQPKPEARKEPERKPQAAPKRESQPKPEARKEPERKPQAAPKRESQPKPEARKEPERKPQAAPKRESQPKPEARKQPERKPQAAPQRESRPKPQARPQPQPKPQAAPQRTEQPGKKGNNSSKEESEDKKSKGSKQ